MGTSVIISTYGEWEWADLAYARAYTSALDLDPKPSEILIDHFPDLSIAQARNAVARDATGDWLCFLDADDELHHRYLREMERAMRGTSGASAGIVLVPAVAWVKNGRRQRAKLMPRVDLRDDNWVVVGALLPRWLFEEVGGFEDYPHGFEDWSLWAKCYRAGAEFKQVPNAHYIAHVNPHSKHREAWRDRRQQVATHQRIRAELFPEQAA